VVSKSRIHTSSARPALTTLQVQSSLEQYDPLLMAHPRRRDGSGLRRTRRWSDCTVPPPADANACLPMPTPACRRQRLPTDANSCAPPPLLPSLSSPRRRVLSVRPTGNFRTRETFRSSRAGLTPKENYETGDVAPNDKSGDIQNAALCSLALATFRTPPPAPLGPHLRPPLATLPHAFATQPPPWRPKTAAAAPPRAERSCADPGATLRCPEVAVPIQYN
jgi:hypothetical protein